MKTWYLAAHECLYFILRIAIEIEGVTALNTGVTLNTELDTVYLFVRHGQRTHFGVYPLVCPFSTWPGQGFYVELFLIDAFPSEWQSKWKRVFSWFFQWKDIQLAVLLHNFREHKIIIFNNLYIFNFILILLGKAELSVASCTSITGDGKITPDALSRFYGKTDRLWQKLLL